MKLAIVYWMTVTLFWICLGMVGLCCLNSETWMKNQTQPQVAFAQVSTVMAFVIAVANSGLFVAAALLTHAFFGNEEPTQ